MSAEPVASPERVGAMVQPSAKGRWTTVFRRVWPAAQLGWDGAFAPDGRNISFLSRQRITGPTNGSSTYVLSLARYLRRHGYRVHYVSPSPATFGRWPAIRIGAELDAAFDSIAIRKGVRIGPYLVAADAGILFRAAATVIEEVLLRAGLVKTRRLKPAAYAVAAPLTPDDERYLAARSPALADVVLCDYAFLTPALPFLPTRGGRSLVLMHDLFSSRADQFAKVGASDSVASLTFRDEMALLGLADIVIAIQKQEADLIAPEVGRPVIVVPMAVDVVPAAAVGSDRTILFVGSNTAPNVVGLEWFFDAVWPLIRARHPGLDMIVAGTVGRAVSPPPGVTCVGMVPDLAPLYAQAGVVVSPLTTGSGLKIKLIEGLGHGKAMVVTSATLQGVEAEMSGAVRMADDPSDFAGHVCDLLENPTTRFELAGAALNLARTKYSDEGCYSPLLKAMSGDPDAA